MRVAGIQVRLLEPRIVGTVPRHRHLPLHRFRAVVIAHEGFRDATMMYSVARQLCRSGFVHGRTATLLRYSALAQRDSPSTSAAATWSSQLDGKNLLVYQVRHLRSGHRGSDEKGHKEETTEGADDKKEESSNEEQEAPKVSPKLIRKLRIYAIIVAGLSFLTSYMALSNYGKDPKLKEFEGFDLERLNRPGIDLHTFLEKYLASGEVRSVVILGTRGKSIAFLQRGAIIDGQPVKDDSVVIDYPMTDGTHNPATFLNEIRKKEAELGIGIAQGVPIDYRQGMTTFKLVELFIGLTILAFLGIAYSRALGARLKNPPKPPPTSG